MSYKKEIPVDEITLTEDMGGEIAELIRSSAGKVYYCLGLPVGHTETVGTWYAYPHEGGLADKDGRRWWAYQKCTHSNYEMAYWKIQRRETHS